jgi:predicted metal-dependent hydrolase
MVIHSKKDLNDKEILLIWHKAKAKEYLIEKTEELVLLHSFKARKITVRSQKTRWGSCSAKNDISLNSALIKCPPKIIDYVIYHELAHTIEKNHSKRFWDLLATYFPDYPESRKWLKRNGNMILI